MSAVTGEFRHKRIGSWQAAGTRRSLSRARLRAGLAVGMILLVGGLGVHALLAPGRFPVQKVEFVGHFPRVPRARLIAAIAPFMRANFYALDLSAVTAAVRTVPWAAHVSVTRHFPRTLDIAIDDQHVIARWAKGGFVNDRGQKIALGGYKAPTDVPVFVGPKGAQQKMLRYYRHFRAALAPLSLVITKVALSARQSWRLTLSDGITLVLGRTPNGRLLRLMQVFPQLVAQVSQIRSIDLRYTNGFAVRWRKGNGPGDEHG